MSKQVPATVFTGFLGSGKTTIITHLLEYLDGKGQKVAYLKNEIGDADLDAQLVRGKNFIGKEILNGCICCTLVGPFLAAIDELIDEYHMDRIVIESAGSADPASMALMISNHPRMFRDGVISIVDVLNFEGYQDLSIVAARQAELTDLIVLNKLELVDDDQKRRVVGYIRELNAKAPIVEAPLGKLNPDLAFGIASKDLDELLDDDHDHVHHLEDDSIQAFSYRTEKVFDSDKFILVLQNRPKQLFRVKGLVRFSDGPQVVNTIFQRSDFSLPPESMSDSGQTTLICIGYKISALEEQIKSLFDGCEI
jgi:G3E family GTPase